MIRWIGNVPCSTCSQTKKWVRSKGFFGEPLTLVITRRGQIFVSRTDDDPPLRPVCPFKLQCVRSKRPRTCVSVHTRTFWTDTREFYQCVTPYTTPHTHHNSNNIQQHTETEPERDRERQRKKTEKERKKRRWKTKDKGQEKRRGEKIKRSREDQDEREEKREIRCVVCVWLCGCDFSFFFFKITNNQTWKRFFLPAFFQCVENDNCKLIYFPDLIWQSFWPPWYFDDTLQFYQCTNLFWCHKRRRFRMQELLWTRNGKSSRQFQHGTCEKSKTKRRLFCKHKETKRMSTLLHRWTCVTSKMRR